MTAALDAELDGLVEAARRYADRHERIPDLTWPDGHRIAVNFTADFDAMLLRRLMEEPPQQLAMGEFGGRVGIWRLIELFDAHRVTATIFTVGRICELYPDAVRAAVRSGHEVTDHMWEHRVPKEPELERDHIERSTAALRALTGRQPAGTRSHHSHGLLREHGYIYRSNNSADHRPFYLRDADGRNCMVNLPFHYAIDDAMYFSFAWMGTPNAAQRMHDPEHVLDLWWTAFRQQYNETAGYLNICLHPFVSGRAQRIAMLDTLITRMKSLPGVWFPSCEAMARHCLTAHPPRGGWA
jgi:peptidoglycan/xylan/chitin deacetylase (PgdA/CDA1 family)